MAIAVKDLHFSDLRPAHAIYPFEGSEVSRLNIEIKKGFESDLSNIPSKEFFQQLKAKLQLHGA